MITNGYVNEAGHSRCFSGGEERVGALSMYPLDASIHFLNFIISTE